MSPGSWGIPPGGPEPPRAIVELAEQVKADGGTPLALYQEPIGGVWQVFALLPLDRVAPTPYQRDLSPSHAKRLQAVIEKMHRFLDPVVAVRGADGKYWTPNGNHRREALRKLKAGTIPVILIAETAVAFQILAMNTEKAHNLKEKSLEVIRMYRVLRDRGGGGQETDFALEFEEAHHITLGLMYERKPRFAGGAFAPILRRVDRFLEERLDQGYGIRERRADQVEAADRALNQVVAALKENGISHPYVKNFVLARCNPLSRARKTVPSFEEAVARLEAALGKFDAGKVRPEQVARAGLPA